MMMLRIHERLRSHGIAHAFGGALALAWCTGRPRGTIDIDLNVFAGTGDTSIVVAALPGEVAVDAAALHQIEREGQARLWWHTTPVDVFLNTTDYHERVGTRVRWEPFAGSDLPFLACDDLAVFKAFFDRTKDWADLEAMVEASSLDVETVAAVLAEHLGADDRRIARLRTLA